MPYGATGKGGPARGSWGDGYLIEKQPRFQKRVSCGTCINYCEEDKSCNVLPIYPPVDGYDYWKRCNKFDLSPEFDDNDNRKRVMAVKGMYFFLEKEEEIKQDNKNGDNKYIR